MNYPMIHLACNDHRNGVFDGKLRAVVATSIIKGHKQWYGNWCWDVVWMHPKPAADFLNYLKTLSSWSVDGGACGPPVDWGEAWEKGTFTKEMFKQEMSYDQRANH
jgi:hypothetical protein